MNKNEKKAFNYSCYGDEEGSHKNQLESALMNWESTRKLKIAIKKDLSPDLNHIDYAIWGVLKKQNKCNFPSK